MYLKLSVLTIFVYRPPREQNDHVSASVAAIMQPCLESMNMSLAQFSAHTEAGKQKILNASNKWTNQKMPVWKLFQTGIWLSNMQTND